MVKLEWDASLASASQSWANKCIWGHDPKNSQNAWGENLAIVSGNRNVDAAWLESRIEHGWYDEVEHVQVPWADTGLVAKNYADPRSKCPSAYDSANQKCMIGHYTQVVWAKTTKVGCAVSFCDSVRGFVAGTYLVCKYNPPGFQGTFGVNYENYWK